jgi:hypothetical protein
MRHRVALVTMALGCVMAGSARANDATSVIYDLSVLQEPKLQHSAAARADRGVPMANLPLSTPSLESGRDGTVLFGDGVDEIRQPGRQPRVVPGVGAPRGGNDNDPNPTPNPEPGTMLLLGSALATGARYMRTRRKA